MGTLKKSLNLVVVSVCLFFLYNEQVALNDPEDPSRFTIQRFLAKQTSGQDFVALVFLSFKTFTCVGEVLGASVTVAPGAASKPGIGQVERQ